MIADNEDDSEILRKLLNMHDEMGLYQECSLKGKRKLFRKKQLTILAHGKIKYLPQTKEYHADLKMEFKE